MVFVFKDLQCAGLKLDSVVALLLVPFDFNRISSDRTCLFGLSRQFVLYCICPDGTFHFRGQFRVLGIVSTALVFCCDGNFLRTDRQLSCCRRRFAIIGCHIFFAILNSNHSFVKAAITVGAGIGSVCRSIATDSQCMTFGESCDFVFISRNSLAGSGHRLGSSISFLLLSVIVLCCILDRDAQACNSDLQVPEFFIRIVIIAIYIPPFDLVGILALTDFCL